jgi:mono/diheme cytochrome c family protein
MIRWIPAVLLFSTLSLAASAQAPGNTGRWGTIAPGVQANLARHQRVLLSGVPAPYRSMHDPAPYAHGKTERGAVLFEQNCAACHGSAGLGNGPGGQVLQTAPADLAWLARTPMGKSDPYVYWSVAEGGVPFGSDMPAFKNRLSPQDIWALVSYIRDGMPRIG